MRRLLVLICAAYACGDPFSPTPRAGLTFLNVPSTADTVDAQLGPFVVELRDADLEPLSDYLRFRSENASVAASPGETFHDDLTIQTDANGRAEVWVQLGRESTAARLVVIGPSIKRDTLVLDVLPGAAAGIAPVPRDTALRPGVSFTLAVRASDRYGNPRPEVIRNFTLQSVGSPIITVQGSTIAATSTGFARIQVTSGEHTATARVFSIDATQLAAVEGTLRVVDFTSGTVQSPGNVTARCADWHPDGNLIVVDSLRLVTLSGQVTTLDVGNEIVPGCGSFSADGDWIWFDGRSSSDGGWHIWRVRVDGSDLELAVSRAAQPATSPDGTRLAYSPDQIWGRVVVRTLATGSVDTVSEQMKRCGDPYIACGPTSIAWSPTGEWIAYAQETRHYFDHWRLGMGDYGSTVRLVSPDASETRDLAPAGMPPHHHGFENAVRWSPDGEWLIGTAFRPDLRLLLVHVPTGEGMTLGEWSRGLQRPVWMP